MWEINKSVKTKSGFTCFFPTIFGLRGKFSRHVDGMVINKKTKVLPVPPLCVSRKLTSVQWEPLQAEFQHSLHSLKKTFM